MKKIFFLPIIALLFFSFSSCDEDESLSPLPPKVTGQFIKLDVTQRQLDFNNLDNAFFGGTLYNTSGKVVRYELTVKRVLANGTVYDNYLPLETYTSFPAQMVITPQKIAAAFNVSVSDLGDGEVYRFLGYSYDANGKKTGYSDLSRSVQIANFVEQGYRFNTSLTSNLDPDYNNRDLQL